MPGMIVSNPAFWKSALTPSLAARASPSSTSQPTIFWLEGSTDSLGGYDASVPMVSLPSALIESGTEAAQVLVALAAGAAPIVPLPEEPPPHALRERPA